ncbi:hypothetical protein [Halobellus ordinarius]|uniref:hypothetical protein n=1 Tax=Halobellus ordinarius TaxID=3075120 RepID=UPI00288010E8|nr:hypothetical protein [Halobellus sp. ZY16]
MSANGDDDDVDGGGAAADGGGEEPATDETAPAAEVSVPLDGDVIRYTGATASVAPARIGPLLRQVQAHLSSRLDVYRRSYECALDDEERAIFLVPEGHWDELGAELGLSERAIDAARRAHAQQLRRIGSTTDRREEYETALEIREAVVIGT